MSLFRSEISDLNKQIGSFQDSLCNFNFPKDIKIIEEFHKKISFTFQNILKEIQAVRSSTAKNMNSSNQDEFTFNIIIPLSEQEAKVSKLMTSLNERILSVYPTANIEYGKECIGNLIPPNINTKDPKFLNLLSQCDCIREIRGDGNCFLSAFTTRFLETLIKDSKMNASFFDFLMNDTTIDPLLKESLLETLIHLNEHPSQIEKMLHENQKIVPFICYFRIVAANEMKSNADKYKVFFLSDIEHVYKGNIPNRSFNSLVDEYVLPLGIDFSQPMITALCTKLNFPVTIFNPKTGSPQGLKIASEKGPSKGTFCLNEAHYFVLYFKEKTAPIQDLMLHLQPQTSPAKPTEIIIKCRVPFGDTLFIRGEGFNLSWNKGIPLIQLDDETWIFQTLNPLDDVEYKFLINDTTWETGSNHKILQGKCDEKAITFDIPAPSPVSIGSFLQHVPTTRIQVKYNAGNNNFLTIRGTGPKMDWNHGIPMKKLSDDLWTLDIQENYGKFKFKVLLNDDGSKFEVGDDHEIESGEKIVMTPKFP